MKYFFVHLNDGIHGFSFFIIEKAFSYFAAEKLSIFLSRRSLFFIKSETILLSVINKILFSVLIFTLNNFYKHFISNYKSSKFFYFFHAFLACFFLFFEKVHTLV